MLHATTSLHWDGGRRVPAHLAVHLHSPPPGELVHQGGLQGVPLLRAHRLHRGPYLPRGGGPGEPGGR